MSKNFTTPLAEEVAKNFEVMVTAMTAISQGLDLTKNATPSGDTFTQPTTPDVTGPEIGGRG